MKTTVRLVEVHGMPIFQQLQLEEAILRTGTENYCLINHDSPPAIVMGISGKVEELIDQDHYTKNPVPIIRRFSGGGTVLIAQDTLFVTVICNRFEVDFGTCPKRLLHWTASLLSPSLEHVDFQVQENDFCIGRKKFGGNAQYFTKSRFLHHASLLWNFDPAAMRVLKMPPKVPEYRQGRNHEAFLTSLSPHFASKNDFFAKFINALQSRFEIHPIQKEEALKFLQAPHRRATEFVAYPST